MEFLDWILIYSLFIFMTSSIAISSSNWSFSFADLRSYYVHINWEASSMVMFLTIWHFAEYIERLLTDRREKLVSLFNGYGCSIPVLSFILCFIFYNWKKLKINNSYILVYLQTQCWEGANVRKALALTFGD
jgi:hypothetical protein